MDCSFLESNISGINSFSWNYNMTEVKQHHKYVAYLHQIITLPFDFEWYDARSNVNLLNAVDQPWLPFNLKGTTDIAILDKGYSVAYGQEASGIRVTIELKKKEQVKQNARFQTQAQLLIANHYSNNNILSLLTDLNDYWEFFWEYDTEICFCRPTSRELAVKMLQDYVNAESNYSNVPLGSEFNVNENDYPHSKRRKLKS